MRAIFYAPENKGRTNKFRLENFIVQSVPYITANIYCKSRNLPNTDIHNYSTDVR